jgi:DNA-binding MarR family transcriptional regulator
MSHKSLNLDNFLPYRLSIVSNLVSDVIAESYQTLFGLKIPEWRLLAVIAETKGTTQLEIGRRTRMDKVTVSRAALAMQDRGLIMRRPNSDDGRSHMLALTSAGAALYRQVVPLALALEQEIFESLSKAEIDKLTQVLDKIMLAAEGVLAKRAGG